MNDAERAATLLRVLVGSHASVTPTDDDWNTWLFHARTQRVVPALHQLASADHTPLAQEHRADSRQVFGAVMCRCVQLEHHTIAVSKALAEHNIVSVVLKGGATSHLDYADPSWREFSDIDLLVSPRDLAAASDLVRGLEWHQGYPLPAGHERFTHAITFVHAGMELDLHQRIAHRSLGRLVSTEELIERAEPFQVAGEELLALDPVDRLIHSCVHAIGASPAPRLSTLGDILVQSRAVTNAERVLARAENLRLRSLIERGVRLAHSTARLELDSRWSEAMRHPILQRDRLVDRAYLGARRRPLTEELAHLRQLDGQRNRLKYLGGYFVIEKSGPRDRLRYLWSKVRGRP